jgi:hypothetical protein
MEHTKLETAVVEAAVKDAERLAQELIELQLAYVGGGCGDTIAF